MILIKVFYLEKKLKKWAVINNSIKHTKT